MYQKIIAAVFAITLGIEAVAAETGVRLFNQHCASCHGVSGEGGQGLPLSAPSVVRSMTDDYIRKTIRYGRPGRVMPAFEQLSDEDVDSLVSYIRGWGDSAVPEVNKVAKGDIQRGAGLFKMNCSSCHAADASGSSEGTGVTFSRPRALPIMAASLRNAGFQQSVSDDMLRYIIRHGRAGTPMASYAHFSEQDIDDVIVYIRSIGEVGEHHQASNDATDDVPSLTVTYDSPHDFEKTVETLRDVIASHNYRTFPDRYLEQGLVDELEVNTRQITVRFCNFSKLYDALKKEPRLGVVLPCAITVVEHEDGSVQLLTTDVEAVARMFNNKELDGAVQYLKSSYEEILDEVTF